MSTDTSVPRPKRQKNDDDPLGIMDDPEVQELVEQDRKALAGAARCVRLRQSRDQGWPEGFVQVARALIIAGLPLRRTTQREVTRKARLGSGTVTVTFGVLGPDAEMPYGNDTNILHFLFDQLDAAGLDEVAQTISISWRSAAEYLHWWNMDPQSHKNQRDLRARWKRIARLAVVISYEGEDQPKPADLQGFLFTRVNLPPSIGRDSSRNEIAAPGQEYGVTLNLEVARRFAGGVPVPKNVLLEYRDDPIAQRLVLFLGYRTYGARTESVIPWKELQDALGSQDQGGRMFRARVRAALKEISRWWPELEATPDARGLRVRPSARPLMPDGASRKAATGLPPPPVTVTPNL